VSVALVSSKAEEVGLKVRVSEAYVTNDGKIVDTVIEWSSISFYAGRVYVDILFR
jgi:hypothetical protein